ncbi:type III PLP-dependent enzyme domain-containing protein [Singulisphaera rosea]
MNLVSVWPEVETPAFVIDEPSILDALEVAGRACEVAGCKLLYALKPMAASFVLELMTPHVEGFATSSPFEARLARSVIGDSGSVHITTPGFRAAEMAEIDRFCDHVAFNSLSQFERLAGTLCGPSKAGLRINPQLPLVDDPRYNPCRPYSKLGAPIDRLVKAHRQDPAAFDGLKGLQFHTNCDSPDFEPWLRTVRHVEERLRGLLPGLEWFNLGGGYVFDNPDGFGILAEAVALLRSRQDLEVFIEPGAALVRDAGYLVAEVIDVFRSGNRVVAVLDTTVNHFPEVFEYQFEPDVLGHEDDGEYDYLLAGCTCLAGDLFGEYSFSRRLELGSRVVMPNVGAYAMVKSHMFNGVNLPTIYSMTAEGRLVLRRRFTYDDFLSRSGATGDASL